MIIAAYFFASTHNSSSSELQVGGINFILLFYAPKHNYSKHISEHELTYEGGGNKSDNN
jgi:hypothetical protein